MPKLSSFSGMSARGFGEFGTTLSLVTTTFTSSGSWTAPAGVTKLTVLSGRGSNGQSDYWSPTYVTRAQVSSAGYPTTNPAYLDWSVPYNYAVSAANSINASGTGPRTVSIPNEYYWVVNNVTSEWVGYPFGFGGSQYVQGSATVVLSPSSIPTSGNIDGPTFFPTYQIATFWVQIDVYYTGAAGTASSGFGQTFPGGAASGGTAPITTFTNVTVTPGTTYSISIPTDRPDPYVTIQYLLPA